jgi:hypothetical protein
MMEQKEAKRSKLPKTEIVCKFFIDAVKKKVYGWKWECPNGDDCHYRHCLPKDYIIKALNPNQQEDMTFEEFQDLELKVDAERDRVALNGTKVTEDTFNAWIERRKKEKEKYGNTDKKAELLKKLKTGKELFLDNKNNYQDDDNADDELYENQNNDLEDLTKNLQNELWGKTDEDENKKEDVKVDEELFKDECEDLDNIDLDEEEKNDD